MRKPDTAEDAAALASADRQVRSMLGDLMVQTIVLQNQFSAAQAQLAAAADREQQLQAALAELQAQQSATNAAKNGRSSSAR